MAKYELMLIVNPSIWEEERNNVISLVKNTLIERDAKIEKEDIWWEKHLAYNIKSSSTWFYVLFDLEMNWKIIVEVNKIMNLNTNIWRYIFVKKEI